MLKKSVKFVLRPPYKLVRHIVIGLNRLLKIQKHSSKITDKVDKLIESKNLVEKSDKIQFLLENLWYERFVFSVLERLNNIEPYKNKIAKYGHGVKTKNSNKLKIVVYSAIVDNYDAPKLHDSLNPNFDYVIFSSTPLPDTKIFKVRPITYFNENPTRAARFIKTHPHLLLGEYDIAIWLDASIMISADIYPLVEKFLSAKLPLAAIPHPHRNTIYEELAACIKLNKDVPHAMEEQVNYYRSINFPGKDLIESGFMIFDLRNKKLPSFFDLWWAEIDKYSSRDQLSLSYALNKSGLNWHKLSTPPHSIRDHPSFILIPHQSNTNQLMKSLIHKVEDGLIDPYQDTSYASVKKQRVANQKNTKIDVVVCVHNALKEVKLCLDSLVKHRRSKNQKLIIVDDGSDAPTVEYLKAFAAKITWARLIRHQKAKRYTKAANAGLKASTGDLVILLNSDTVVTEGWAEKMADALDATPGAGIVGPMSNAASIQSIPDYRSSGNQTAINELPSGKTPEDMNKYCEQWTPSSILPRVPLVHGFCFGIKRGVINKIGFFDEKNFPRGYGEENDYCFRATNAGFGSVIATHTFVFHAKSKSYVSSERVKLMKQGSKKLAELHSKRRITNSIRSMVENSLLSNMRERAKNLY